MWYDPVDCNGKFVRHHTFVKDMTKTTTANSVMQALIDIMKTNFAGLAKDVVISENEHKENKQKQEEEHKATEKRIVHEPVKRR
jgi:hypothetical protein